MNQPPNNDHPSTPDHTLSTASKLLANAKRRTAVQYFSAEETDTAELDELVDHIHEEVDAVTAPDQVRIALIHKHLPKLADYDVIEYYERSETVRYRDSDCLQFSAKDGLTEFAGIPTHT
jgi:hypothetical protein